MAFRHDIESISGQNVNLCFQCSKCSSGCPLADKMDLKPAQVRHSVRLGREETVLNSNTIWLCLECETGSARCPQQVEPAAARGGRKKEVGREAWRLEVRRERSVKSSKAVSAAGSGNCAMSASHFNCAGWVKCVSAASTLVSLW